MQRDPASAIINFAFDANFLLARRFSDLVHMPRYIATRLIPLRCERCDEKKFAWNVIMDDLFSRFQTVALLQLRRFNFCVWRNFWNLHRVLNRKARVIQNRNIAHARREN